ncbi:hypothetical protein N825_26935 [Skermanella stibiiresistens SB22]|uniref:HD-GYP domain-containing protein n=1 Tax=Skermanella stibiiresistens SB22 TaxID=1385369 RepID=W9GRJ9_9PROT|nr:HD domain-containing phosphohydrolase [Skermanella stibiiresistens]EWY36384.1 hypothetical protein N825_26935 [Skermanella stibiiresistens SB22]
MTPGAGTAGLDGQAHRDPVTADASLAGPALPCLGIPRAVALFGEDVDGVGAYNHEVGDLVAIVCGLLGFDAWETGRWRRAAALHDLGKLWIPVGILLKRGPLDQDEVSIMRDHVVLGHARLRHHDRLAAEMALHHHENHDGTGYPFGLAGEDIPVSARVVRLCDVYDALRAARPYKRAMSHEEATRIILFGDDRIQPGMFDPELLHLFALHHQRFAAYFDR